MQAAIVPYALLLPYLASILRTNAGIRPAIGVNSAEINETYDFMEELHSLVTPILVNVE